MEPWATHTTSEGRAVLRASSHLCGAPRPVFTPLLAWHTHGRLGDDPKACRRNVLAALEARAVGPALEALERRTEAMQPAHEPLALAEAAFRDLGVLRGIVEVRRPWSDSVLHRVSADGHTSVAESADGRSQLLLEPNPNLFPRLSHSLSSPSRTVPSGAGDVDRAYRSRFGAANPENCFPAAHL